MKKARVLKTSSNRNFPDDLWAEILSLLPVDSLLRSRCVSRSWRSIIDGPDFARLHLDRLHTNRCESNLLFTQLNRQHRRQEFVLRSIKTLKITRKLGLVESSQGDVNWTVNCTVDGLILLKDRDLEQLSMLWNPYIRKTRILPPPPEICGEIPKFHDIGIGFDPLTKDYKFVRFLQEGKGVSLVAVYTVGTNSWKTIDFQGEGCSPWRENFNVYYGKTGISFGGVIYALASNIQSSSPQLVSFDLSSEMFDSIKLPQVVDPLPGNRGSQILTVIDGGCSLALVNLSMLEGSIWALESLGADLKTATWTQRYTFALSNIPEREPFMSTVEFLTLNENGEMLLRWFGMVTSYNLETHKEEILLKRDLHKGWPYTESLVLL